MYWTYDRANEIEWHVCRPAKRSYEALSDNCCYPSDKAIASMTHSRLTDQLTIDLFILPKIACMLLPHAADSKLFADSEITQ